MCLSTPIYATKTTLLTSNNMSALNPPPTPGRKRAHYPAEDMPMMPMFFPTNQSILGDCSDREDDGKACEVVESKNDRRSFGTSSFSLAPRPMYGTRILHRINEDREHDQDNSNQDTNVNENCSSNRSSNFPLMNLEMMPPLPFSFSGSSLVVPQDVEVNAQIATLPPLPPLSASSVPPAASKQQDAPSTTSTAASPAASSKVTSIPIGKLDLLDTTTTSGGSVKLPAFQRTGMIHKGYQKRNSFVARSA